MWYVKAWKDWKQNGLFSEENIRLAQIPRWSLTVPSTEPQFDESVTITTRMVFIKRNGTSSFVDSSSLIIIEHFAYSRVGV